ncbi:hypothetical protein [Agrobacterium pusense]|uniref:hypothetical protein n=1 Tax=Agrobacterium pusense TaxID=648995 RepID=UPI003FD0EF1E
MARSEICWMMLFCLRSNSFSSRIICSRSAFGRRSLDVSCSITFADMVSNIPREKKAAGRQSRTRLSSSWRVMVLLLLQQVPPSSSIGRRFLRLVQL